MWRVEGAAAFERGSNGRMGELAGCVMSAYEVVVVGFSSPRYLCVCMSLGARKVSMLH